MIHETPHKYNYLYTVAALNNLVKGGVSFRDAYKQVGEEVEKGTFKKPQNVEYTHEGSIGNLCNEKINFAMENVLRGFNFAKWQKALKELVK